MPAQSQAEQANGFRILSASTHLNKNVFQLEAKINLNFSDDALEALRSGVPLIILLNIEVLKDRNWWWDKTVAELEQGYLLLYHALSEKYIIHNLNSGAQKNYGSLNAALYSLSNIHEFPLIDKNLLEAGDEYYARIRTYLDIESLPAPMRPIAYISSQWQLESDWFTWPLKH
ncbi:MAG: DUF4390 domain-containing protein [Gammaproteobacteria bacterium]|nr:DUF4390 domain-containing protein [Gammaproteobacteria bacterium]MCW9031706.1 DUF4390 domain-containing protein [Gammaproteobacteria bacterium]